MPKIMPKNKYILASLFWALLILAASITPGSEIKKAGVGETGSKLAHFGEFLVFGYLLIRASPDFKKPIIILLFYAVFTEILQLYVPGRFFEYSDLGLNVAGSVAGLASKSGKLYNPLRQIF